MPEPGVIPPEYLVRGKELPHVALANLIHDDKALADFYHRYGHTLSDPWLLQDALRKAWTGDNDARQWLFHKYHRVSVRLFPEGLGILADDVGTFACICLISDLMEKRAAVCASPDCPAPYFVRARKGQKFCSHTCAILISVRRLRERQKKAMKLLEATERKKHRKRTVKSSRRAKR